MKYTYEVLVGNVGTVHVGNNRRAAVLCYKIYVDQSRTLAGRCAGEPVTLLVDGEISEETEGTNGAEVTQ